MTSPNASEECPGCGATMDGDYHPFPKCEWFIETFEPEVVEDMEREWEREWRQEQSQVGAYQRKVMDDTIILCALSVMSRMLRHSKYPKTVQKRLNERIIEIIKRYNAEVK